MTDLVDMDTEAYFNLRDWLEAAITNHGAKVTGKGLGGGASDLWFKLEGMEYFVSIKPVVTRDETLRD